MVQDSTMYTDWCLTVFQLDSVIYHQDLMQYCCYQLEECPESHKHHLQCFVVFRKRVRFSAVKRLFPLAHIEKRMGTRTEAIAYCSKDATRLSAPLTFGTLPEDSVGMKRKITEELVSKTVLQVIDETPNLWRNYRVLTQIRSSVSSPRNFLTCGILLTGPTGCGKSLLALHVSALLGSVYYADPTLKWFDGYDGQEVIVVDEFRGAPISLLLRMLDRYPMLLPIKGAMTQLYAKYIIFTSNLVFQKMFKYLDIGTYLALRRRLVEIKF